MKEFVRAGVLALATLSGNVLGSTLQIDLDATIHGDPKFGHAPMVVTLDAGTYRAAIAGPDRSCQSDYYAWSFEAGLTGTWNTMFRVKVGNDVTFGGDEHDSKTAATSYERTRRREVLFDVPETTAVLFYVPDNILFDNVGGVSITVNLADEPAFCAGDVNVDCMVGFVDLVQVLAAWGPCPGCLEDVDRTADVGFEDVVQVLATWGSCPDSP